MNEDEHIFVRYNVEFNALRVLDRIVMPTTWKIRTEMIIEDKITDEQFNHILVKLKYFFSSILGNSIIFSASNEWATIAFTEGDLENELVVLPFDPVDDVMAIVLQSKLNALGEGIITFHGVEIESNNANGISFVFVGNGEKNLPNMEEWIGERSYFDKPWWARNDSSTYDLHPDEDDDLNMMKDDFSLDFLKEMTNPEPEEATTKVIRPEFRPTIIQGYKKEDDKIKE